MEDLKLEMTTKSSPPFIFQLPESVGSGNPDAFLPHHITLGPHNWNNKMMDSYKHSMAKKVHNQLHLPQFNQLCRQLRGTLELKIRACYNTHLEIDGHRLAKITLTDTLFLLGLFLHVSGQLGTSEITPTLPLSNFDEFLNDVVKLKNQIPLMVLKTILQRPNSPNLSLPVLLYHFVNSVSPVSLGFFKPTDLIGGICYRKYMLFLSDWYVKSRPPIFNEILDQSHHLLHYMYMAILVSPTDSDLDQFKPESLNFAKTSSSLNWLSKLVFVLDTIEPIKDALGLIQKLFVSAASKTTSSPLIPSASQLHKLPFNFKITYRGILYAKFIKHPGTEIQHVRTRNGIREVQVQLPPTLNLPQITVNAYTETVLENLLAFEAMANINPPVFARYLQLMKALIKTPKDLNILKEEKIIETTHDDEQVVKLFNRVGNYSISRINKNNNPITTNDDLHRSFQPKNEIFEMMNENYEKGLKGMVEEINQCYEGFWIVRAKRYFKKLWIYVVKMMTILQIFVVLGKLVNSIIGNDVDDDEPIYQIPPT